MTEGKKQLDICITDDKNTTHEKEDGGTEEHQVLHCGLIKWILYRIRMFVITVIAFPRCTKAVIVRIGATATDKLELSPNSM
jgi:hypothetical protein